MSNIFVTSGGFLKKTLAELKLEYEALFQAEFGSDIDLDPDGPFGQIIGILSKRDADLWDGAEEIYNSRNVNAATGQSLDNIAAETGVIRIDAIPTRVEDVILYGDEGTVVPLGKQVRQATNAALLFSLEVGVTISAAAARHIQITIDDPAAGGIVYTVTINGTAYTYTSIISDTRAIVLNALVALINAGAWTGTPSNSGNTILNLIDTDFDFSVVVSGTMDIELIGSGGIFVCDADGVNPVPANTLNTIVSPVSGWDTVNNPSAGITGAEKETDDAFRLRRQKALISGNATEEAIRSKLLTQVDNVSNAIVYSNRTMITDGEGRPPKSFEAIVVGGTDAAVAAKLWETMPAGIESYGNTTVVVTDSQGFSQSVEFSRPESTYVWVKVWRALFSEEEYPANGDDLIKQAIVDWALANQTIGKDVVRQRLSIPVYSVPGIGDILIELAETAAPSPPPGAYSAVDIVIGAREIPVFATSQITVVTLP